MASWYGKVPTGVTNRAIFAILLAVAAMIGAVTAEQDFAAMKVKELKAFLKKRGADCLACSSKEDFVERAMETKDWEEVEEEVKMPKFEGENFEHLFKDSQLDEDQRMEKLKEALEKAGVDTSTLFTNGKILNADELAKNFQQKDPEMYGSTDVNLEEAQAKAEENVQEKSEDEKSKEDEKDEVKKEL